MGQQAFTQNQANTKFCTNCGNLIASQAELCLNCGVRQNSTAIPGGKSRVAAGLLAIFLGAFLGCCFLLLLGGCLQRPGFAPAGE